MTTIAYRDGVIAADSRVTIGSMVHPESMSKLVRLSSGGVLASAGTVAQMEALKEHMLTTPAEDPPDMDDITSMRIDPDGKLWNWEGAGPWRASKAKFYALGNGCGYAYGAMEAGASAREAVKIATKYDTSSGLPVTWMKVCEPKKKKGKADVGRKRAKGKGPGVGRGDERRPEQDGVSADVSGVPEGASSGASEA